MPRLRSRNVYSQISLEQWWDDLREAKQKKTRSTLQTQSCHRNLKIITMERFPRVLTIQPEIPVILVGKHTEHKMSENYIQIFGTPQKVPLFSIQNGMLENSLPLYLLISPVSRSSVLVQWLWFAFNYFTTSYQCFSISPGNWLLYSERICII